MTEELEQLLKNLKLRRLLNVYDEQLQAAEKAQTSYTEFVAGLLRAQWHERQESALEWRIHRANLPERWSLETFPWSRQPGVNRKQMRGFGQQARLFFGEDLGNGTAVVSRPASPMRHLIAPEQCLPVAFGERGEGTARPEGFANIANGSLHATFLITGADLTGTSDEVIMSAELHQSRVEVDLVASAFEHRAAKVVVKNHARLAGPVLEGMDMAAQKVLHRLVEEELQIQRPRPRQRGHEAGQRAAGAAHGDLAEVSPVHLGLFGGERLQSSGKVRARAGAAGPRRAATVLRCRCNRVRGSSDECAWRAAADADPASGERTPCKGR